MSKACTNLNEERMRYLILRATCGICLAALAAFLPACRTTMTGSAPKPNDLVVGVCPDYPPLMFRQNDRLMGVEVELAAALGKALSRTVRFLEIRWEDQIESLMQGRTDIIMSGMTITDARKVRVAFSDPYLELGIMPLVRARDAAKYNTPESILGGNARIGVKKGSTADVFANKYGRSSAITYVLPPNAHFFLINRRIDVYLHDGPGVIWLAAEHEADLQVIRKPLTSDQIAWALRKDDAEMLETVNKILAGWKKDGTLQRILHKWLPQIEANE
ncbi:MAG: ABC transporter substrate-binding protein [Kiritimatiellia bacterium]